MKRVTVTIPDDLEGQIDGYLRRQEASPSLAALTQAALREYLANRAWQERGYRPAPGPLRLQPVVAEDAPGEEDASLKHDHYFTEVER